MNDRLPVVSNRLPTTGDEPQSGFDDFERNEFGDIIGFIPARDLLEWPFHMNLDLLWRLCMARFGPCAVSTYFDDARNGLVVTVRLQGAAQPLATSRTV